MYMLILVSKTLYLLAGTCRKHSWYQHCIPDVYKLVHFRVKVIMLFYWFNEIEYLYQKWRAKEHNHLMSTSSFLLSCEQVFFAAITTVITQRSSQECCVTTLITAVKETSEEGVTKLWEMVLGCFYALALRSCVRMWALLLAKINLFSLFCLFDFVVVAIFNLF